jgi:hypothetical protein
MAGTSGSKAYAYCNVISLLIGGLALGWLVGLSVSPVLHLIVASILSLAVAATSALAGIRLKADECEHPSDESGSMVSDFSIRRVNLLPLGLLTAAIATGASMGIFARTNNLLGLYPAIAAKRWADAGMANPEIKKRMFDAIYSSSDIPSHGLQQQQPSDKNGGNKGEGPQNPLVSGASLYAVDATQCNLLDGKDGDDLKTALIGLGNESTRAAVSKCTSKDCFQAIREVLCHGR